MGDLEGAAEAALRVAGADGRVPVRAQRRACARASPRASRARSACASVGFTDRMGDWLAAADALVHSTAGLTVLEAIIRGCPVISYGWGRGHIRANNRAYRALRPGRGRHHARRARRRPATRARAPARARPLAHAASERGGGDPGDGGAMSFDTAARGGQHDRPGDHGDQADSQNGAAQRGGAPVLAADAPPPRRPARRSGRRGRSGATRVAGRRCRADISLSVASAPAAAASAADGDGGAPAPVGQLAGHELRGERGHAVRGARRDDGEQTGAAPAQHVGRQRQRGEGDHGDDHPGPAGDRAALGRGDGQAGDAGDHERDRDELAGADGLAEHARAEEEQQQQPERERRLDERQWRERQGEHLQRPAEKRERGGGEPARVADELAEQRDAQRMARADPARLQRLEGVAGLVAGGRQRRPRRGRRPSMRSSLRPSAHASLPSSRVGRGVPRRGRPRPRPPHAPRAAPPPCASRGAPRALPGVALTFDDGPHPAGHAGGARRRWSGPARARRSSSSASRCAATPRSRARSSPPGTPWPCTATATAASCALTPRALDDDLARVAATVADATGPRAALYRPPYGVFSAAGLALVRRRGWRDAAVVALGRDWRGARHAGGDRARAPTRDLAAGDVVLLHDADTYSARGLVAAHRAGAAGGARGGAARRAATVTL